MPCPVPSFLSQVAVLALKHSWQNSMLTHVPPPPAPPPQLEVAHTFGLPATAAVDALFSAQLTLALTDMFSILPPIFYLTAPLFRFFVIAYLRTIRLIICSGL